MKATLLSIALLIIAPLQSYAERNCTDRPECWPEGSAMHTGLLAREKMETINIEMQKTHRELVSLISTKYTYNGKEYLEDQRLVEAVTAQQKSWENYKNNECELVGALSSGASQWQSVESIYCETKLTEQRLMHVKEAVTCVEKIAVKERRFNQQQCLYQLAPMAGPNEKQP